MTPSYAVARISIFSKDESTAYTGFTIISGMTRVECPVCHATFAESDTQCQECGYRIPTNKKQRAALKAIEQPAVPMKIGGSLIMLVGLPVVILGVWMMITTFTESDVVLLVIGALLTTGGLFVMKFGLAMFKNIRRELLSPASMMIVGALFFVGLVFMGLSSGERDHFAEAGLLGALPFSVGYARYKLGRKSSRN